MTVQTNVKISTLGYVILYVRDTEKAITFYKDKLGLKVKIHEDGWVELDTGATTLALHREDKPGVRGGAGQPVVVFNVENVHSTYNALKALGITFDEEPHMVCDTGDHMGMSADFQDPDGNSLSIFGLVPKQ